MEKKNKLLKNYLNTFFDCRIKAFKGNLTKLEFPYYYIFKDNLLSILKQNDLIDALKEKEEPKEDEIQDIDLNVSFPSVDLITNLKYKYRHYRALGHQLRLLLQRGTIPRPQEAVRREYAELGRSGLWDWNALISKGLYYHNGELSFLPLLAFRQGLIKALARVCLRVKAKTVCEFGCGEGVNLGLLAKWYPTQFRQITWLGFEFTCNRARRAKILLNNHFGLDNVFIWNGDAKKTYLKNNAFDLVYSVCVLEQMPYDWRKMLLEMKRTSRYILLAEPFYERKSFGGKVHSRLYDYFRAKISDLSSMGFEIIKEYKIPVLNHLNEITVILLRKI